MKSLVLLVFAICLLILCAQSFAADYLVPLPQGCTVSGKTQLSGSCDAAVPVPVPTSACPIIPNSAGGSFSRWAGMQSVGFCSGGCVKSVDVTKFDSIFGAWPGSYGLIAYTNLPVKNYLSAQFTIPPNYMTAANRPNPLFGGYRSGETGNDAPYSVSISTQCGDFSNPLQTGSTVVPGCWKNRLGTSGVLQWNAAGTSCVLKNGVTYFANFISAEISKVGVSGTGTAASTKNAQCGQYSCSLPIMNGPGTWFGYHPAQP